MEQLLPGVETTLRSVKAVMISGPSKEFENKERKKSRKRDYLSWSSLDT